MRIGIAFFFFLTMFVVGVLLLKFSATSDVLLKNRLVIISPHWEGIQYEFERAFKKHIRETEDNREIDNEWFDVGGGTSTIKRFLEQEFQKYTGRGDGKDGVGIDVLFGGGTELYLEFSKPRPGPDGKRGGPPILASYQLPAVLLDEIPETLTPSRAPGGIRIYDRTGRCGLEIVETLNDAGIRTRRPLAVGFFTNEEGARFPPDMMGSGVQQGALPLDEMLAAVGIDGKTVGSELERIGYVGDVEPRTLHPARPRPGAARRRRAGTSRWNTRSRAPPAPRPDPGGRHPAPRSSACSGSRPFRGSGWRGDAHLGDLRARWVDCSAGTGRKDRAQGSGDTPGGL